MVFHRASDVGRDAQYRAPDLRSEAVILPSRKFVRDFEYFSSNIHGFACPMRCLPRWIFVIPRGLMSHEVHPMRCLLSHGVNQMSIP